MSHDLLLVFIRCLFEVLAGVFLEFGVYVNFEVRFHFVCKY